MTKEQLSLLDSATWHGIETVRLKAALREQPELWAKLGLDQPRELCKPVAVEWYEKAKACLAHASESHQSSAGDGQSGTRS